MLDRNCKICGKAFKVPKSYGDRRGFYCSSKCYGVSKEGKPSWNKGKKTGLVPKTAFKKGDKRITGTNNWNWKGGIRKCLKGYVWLYRPKHPLCQKNNYVKRSRIIMEKHLGRYLTPTEVVHHINGIKHDDRIANLELFLNHSKHAKFHMLLRYK